MKKLFVLILFIASIGFSQSKVIHAGESDWPNDTIIEQQNQSTFKSSQIMACAANTVFTTGYPAWTNYWAGYMFMVNNTSTCTIIVNCFEARFQGTSGYRIYTKVGTFIGFELLSGSWTLVGSIPSGLTSISTTTGTPIPIVVGVNIPPSSSQSFYLTRTDNVVANRHLYNTGSGTAGVTIYSSDANVQITEAEYVDPFFSALQIGSRRPSFDMYYDKICGVLPIELISFTGIKKTCNKNLLEWSTATENNNDRFDVERSLNGLLFDKIGELKSIGNSQYTRYYSYDDSEPHVAINYYRLKQVDYNGSYEYSSIISVDNLCNKREDIHVIKIINIIGQEVPRDFGGLKFIYYSDGNIKKEID